MWLWVVVTLLLISSVNGKDCYDCNGFFYDNPGFGSKHCLVVGPKTPLKKICHTCATGVGVYTEDRSLVDFPLVHRSCNVHNITKCQNLTFEYKFGKMSGYFCPCEGALCNNQPYVASTTLLPTTKLPTTILSTTTEATTTSTDPTTTTRLLPTTTSIVVVSTTSGQDSTVTGFDNTTVDTNTTLPIQSTTDCSISTTTGGDTTSFTEVTTDQTGTFSTVSESTSEFSTVNPVSTAPALFPTDWSISLTIFFLNYIWFNLL
ncbi:unnamed protein product [Bursaphelenchus okinawaensis]|uniref:Uncharacterized protein n=1 Tax=Bursaphelenchus okinawaensis TaxID=465554 RepID=A0A811L4F0_9BILA|nr:unnamed protein product [Bursaphelenchus okinawaensis]CAG9117091.1 unnamed protein product [Bursaphelenchus okinawaensis]